MARKSKNAYPQDWPEISRQVKDQAGWRCERCGHDHDPETRYTLTVHHLDGDKANNAWWNTAALCQRCHLRIQGKVVMEQPWMFEHSEWFKPYVAGYYAHQRGMPEDREFIEQHLDELLKGANNGNNLRTGAGDGAKHGGTDH